MSKIDDKYYSFLPDNFNYNHTEKNINRDNSILYMFNRSNIMFKYHKLPISIPHFELEKRLQHNGIVVFFMYNNSLYCTNEFSFYGDLDIYNNYTKVNINIPSVNINEILTINKDCVLMKNDSFSMGLFPLYSKYCTLLTENEITMLMYDVNTRVQTFISASDNTTLESANEFIKKLYNGELSAIADDAFLDSLKFNNKSNSATTIKDLVEYHQYLKGSLFNEIGLSANYNMKKERLTQADVELNSDNLYPLVDDMLYNRRLALEKIDEIFGISIEVELNSSWDYRLYNGASIHNTNDEIESEKINDENNEGQNNEKNDENEIN